MVAAMLAPVHTYLILALVLKAEMLCMETQPANHVPSTYLMYR